jgi:S-formylglutathione hydrolase FrmB
MLLVPNSHAAAGAPTDLQQITLYSPALGGTTHVDVLLPNGYATSARRYPVLYLLHGLGGTYAAWSQRTDIVWFARTLPLIVVMPDGGSGWYADPWDAGPRWETYHIGELIPYIDDHYRTIATRNGRAIAGLSMGGFGAFSYAARHPDVFVAAASFSGALDIEALRGSLGLSTVFGASTAWPWRAHSPIDLATNLYGVHLFMSAGNGNQGPLDTSPTGAVDLLEPFIHRSLLTMETALRSAHISATIDDYGNGTHAWQYWQRELHRAMPMLLAALSDPQVPPQTWNYLTADPVVSVWNYTVSVSRPPGQGGYTLLTNVGPRGFTVVGTDVVSITTAPIYAARNAYTVRQSTGAAAVVVADTHGRLHPRFQLGGAIRLVRVTIAAYSRLQRNLG